MAGPSLDEDGADDEDLRNEGDNARCSSFHDTHVMLLWFMGEVPLPKPEIGGGGAILNCKGRH